MKSLITITLLLISFLVYKHSVETSPLHIEVYEDYNKVFKLLKPNCINLSSTQTIPSYFLGYTVTNSTDSLSLSEISLSDEYDLKLNTYKYLPSDYKNYHEDFIEFNGNGKRIYIDSLLKVESNILIEENPYITVTETTDFEFNGDSFILLTCESRNFYRNGSIKSFILIKFKRDQILGSWMFYNSYRDKNVFADFNKDGQLDYLSWRLNDETINIYAFKGNNFLKDEMHFIKLKTRKEKEDVLDWLDEVDIKKSNWFFTLK